jgi:hypothetical protein
VRGIPAGRSADALFFLHAFIRTSEWRPRRNSDQPPVVFQYTVHYGDGKSARVPVLYGRGADHWISGSPSGLKDAALAWAAPFPGSGGDQAVVFQLQWNNPRPEEEVQSIDLEYGPDGNRWGAPVLLAVTAATAMDE